MTKNHNVLNHKCKSWKLLGFLFLIIITFLSVHDVFGAVMRKVENDLEVIEFQSPELYISQSHQPLDNVLPRLKTVDAWENFLTSSPEGYVFIDPRSGRPTTLTQVFPLLPGIGDGNEVTLDELSYKLDRHVEHITKKVVREAAVRFLTEHADVLDIDPAEFGEIRLTNTDGDYLWDVFIKRAVKGIPVRHANVSLGINHGNVSLWGVEKWGDIDLDLDPKIGADEALDIGFGFVGGRLQSDLLIEEPRLEIIPVAPDWDGTIGTGYKHVLVWSYVFTTETADNTWEVLVDAHKGTVLAFSDLNVYARRKIVGSVYPMSNDGCGIEGTAQSRVPMPYIDTGFSSPNDYTTNGGCYEYTSGTAYTTFSGKYVNLLDGCGYYNEQSITGNIDLEGIHGHHDCDVPAGHSPGNTMANRTVAYEVPHINRMARGWTSYAWLDTDLYVMVNQAGLCNASASSSYMKFLTSGGGCSNSGELAGVIAHEWGHVYDYNDTTGDVSNPGEGFADTVAILWNHDSCQGRGFFVTSDEGCGQWTCPTTGIPTGYNCNGYGDCCTDCTGIRDLDYAAHSSGTAHTISNFVCSQCPGSGSRGTCNAEVHCEGYVVAESVWDLATRELTGWPDYIDLQTAFEITTRLAFIGSGSVTDWYTCTCPDISDACGANNGYMRWLNADDDDGNLNNGTPHIISIFLAFDSHEIACVAPYPTNSGCSGGPTSAPTLTAVPLGDDASLSWTSVSGASSYYIFRTEGVMGCDYGKEKIATVSGTTYLDTGVGYEQTYYYMVMAVGSNSACLGPLSNCASVVFCGTPDFTGVETVLDNDLCLNSGIQITWQEPTSWGVGATTGTYDIQRYTDSNCHSLFTLVADDLPGNQTSFTDMTVQPGSTYYYKIRARNNCYDPQTTSGETGCSPAVVDYDGYVPDVVTNNDASDLSACADTGVQITWPADPADWGDADSGSRVYNVIRAGVTIASNLVYGTTSYIDTTGTNGSFYLYKVEYVNGCGLSNTTFGTLCRDRIDAPPLVTTNNDAVDAGCDYTGIEISWNQDPDEWNDGGLGTRHYDVLRDGVELITDIPYGTTSYTDTTANNETPYTYSVRYWNGCDLSNETGGISALDHLASFPSGFSNSTAADVSKCDDSGVLISWAPEPGDWGDNGVGTRTYMITRDLSVIQSFIPQGTSSYLDTEGDNGVLYNYQVQYRNGCYYSASTTGAEAADELPDVPSGLTNNTAEDYNSCLDEGVLISWDADPSEWNDGGEGNRTYNIIRDGVTIVYSLPYGTTSYIDTTGTNGVDYLYRVIYVNGCSFSAITTGVTIKDFVGAAPSGLYNNQAIDINLCTDTGVRITWAGNPGDWGDGGTGTKSYDVLRDGIVIVSNITYGTTMVNDLMGSNNVDYVYSVRYVNGCGFSTETPGVTVMDHVASNPTGVTNNTAVDVSGCEDTGVLISWLADPVDWNDAGSGTRRYNVYRNGITIASDLPYGTNSYTDATGTNGVSYLYTVRYMSGCNYVAYTTGEYAADNLSTSPSGLTNNTAVDLDDCDDSGVVVKWKADPGDWGDNGTGTRTYDVYREGIVIAKSLAYGITNYTDTTGTNGVIYTYTVQYNNGCGQSQTTGGMSAMDRVASSPSGLTENTAVDEDYCDDTGILITWSVDPVDWADNGIGTRYYDVYRNSSRIASGLAYGTTSYIDTTGTNGVSYLYQVQYVNGCNLAAITTGVTATDLIASKPIGSPVTSAVDDDGCNDTGVLITWEADPADWGDNGWGGRTYSISRDGVVIAPDIHYGTTSYLDTTGTNNVTYSYRVDYLNGCVLVLQTGVVQAMDAVTAAPSSLTNNTAIDFDGCLDSGVRITWKANPGDWGDQGYGTRSYDLYRDATPVVSNLPYGTTNYTDTGGTNGVSYLYRIVYRNGCGKTATTSGVQAMDHIAATPVVTTNNSAEDQDVCLDTGVIITWNQDPDDWGDGGTGTRSYYLWRDGSVLVSDIPYGTISYTDTTGTNRTSYHYMISYMNGCGDRVETSGVDASDEIDTTPCPAVDNSLMLVKSGLDVLLDWSDVSCSDLANYRVLGATSFSDPFPGSWIDLGNPTDPEFSISLSTSYVAFKVITIDMCGN